ncbi:MAG: hypothetical protein ACI8WT_003387 [Clostridium sp.]|jgi:hypothetical protein
MTKIKLVPNKLPKTSNETLDIMSPEKVTKAYKIYLKIIKGGLYYGF